MVDERVLETLEHIVGKLLAFVDGQVEGLHEFVELHLVDVASDNGMLACIANDVDSAQESHRREYCVRTIEQSNLASMVRLLIVGDENMKTSLLCGELLSHLFDGHILSLFDDPQVEVLRFHYEVVLVANLLLDFVDGVAWKTRYDAVYECGANIAMIGEPCLESFVVLTKVVFHSSIYW